MPNLWKMGRSWSIRMDVVVCRSRYLGMCMVMCVHSEHLGLKHIARCPGQIDFRKCPKMSSLGLVAGRPTCQNRPVVPVQCLN